MKLLRSLLLLFSLIALLWSVVHIYQVESKKQILKEDYIELSKVKYGLFNIDEWKIILSDIITKKVAEFNLDDTNKEAMKGKITTFLYSAIEEFERNFKTINRKKSWFGVSFKNIIANGVSIFDRLRDEVPNLADQTIHFLEDPENRERIKTYLIQKFNDYASETFSVVDYQLHNSLLKKYNVNDRQSCLSAIEENISELKYKNQWTVYLLLSLLSLQLTALICLKNTTKIEFTIFSLIAISLLALGLLLPMIDIDARIMDMNFSLLGEPVQFKNQVLFFKSKSILEVVKVMLVQGKLELLFVGVLVFLFSVIFPIIKICCSLLLVFDHHLVKYKLVKFMVFKSGKWSMADVMIIAIFMSYLGFSGILTEQLNQLDSLTNSLDIFTTNQTTLQLGFYLFTFFVIFSLFLSSKLQYKIDLISNQSGNSVNQETMKTNIKIEIANHMVQKGFDLKDIYDLTGINPEDLT